MIVLDSFVWVDMWYGLVYIILTELHTMDGHLKNETMVMIISRGKHGALRNNILSSAKSSELESFFFIESFFGKFIPFFFFSVIRLGITMRVDNSI